MKAERVTLTLLLSLGTTMLGMGTDAAAAEIEHPIDWPAFMVQHDMHFDKLPRNWTEAPDFGNAAIGSMLYQDGNTIKLQVFRNDVHDHCDDTWGWPAYSRARDLPALSREHRAGGGTRCAAGFSYERALTRSRASPPWSRRTPARSVPPSAKETSGWRV